MATGGIKSVVNNKRIIMKVGLCAFMTVILAK